MSYRISPESRPRGAPKLTAHRDRWRTSPAKTSTKARPIVPTAQAKATYAA